MMVVNAVTLKEVIPGGRFHVLAPILVPVDIGFVTQDSGPLFADIWHAEEGANIEAHAVVKVRFPAERLLIQRLPAHKNIIRSFACENKLQSFLEDLGGVQAFLRAVNAGVKVLLLAHNPVAKIGINERFQIFVIQFVIIDQRGETVPQAIPDVPDERAVLEQFAMLGKELFPQPGFQRFARMTGVCE